MGQSGRAAERQIPMKILVTGATGFIGKPLCSSLRSAGHSLTSLTRHAARATALLGPDMQHVEWGGRKSLDWQQDVVEADVIVHLAGESVARQRWSPEFKAKIRSSRLDTTRALVDAMRPASRADQALICASAVGYYGDRGEETLSETSPPGKDFLAGVCAEWEAEAHKAADFGVRVASLRIGIVLGQDGALEKMLHPLPIPLNLYQCGLGGPLGSGKQWMPWIHIDDVVGLFCWAAQTPAVRGAVNVTAPKPVRNAEFARAIGKAYGRPAFLPVPAFALHALVGEFAEALLGGQKALPTVAETLGYKYHYTQLEAALNTLLK